MAIDRFPFDEEEEKMDALNLQDSPEIMYDTSLPDLGKYSHDLPTSENTDSIIPERELASIPEDDMGAREVADDDALMAEIQKEQMAAGNLELPDKIPVPPELAGMGGMQELPAIQKKAKMSKLVADYKAAKTPEEKEEVKSEIDHLALLASSQKIGQSMAGKYSGNFDPDLTVTKMLQKNRDKEEDRAIAAKKAIKDQEQQDLENLINMYKLKKLQKGPEVKRSISDDFTTADGQRLMKDDSGKMYTLDGQRYTGETKAYEAPLTKAQEREFNLREQQIKSDKEKGTEAEIKKEKRADKKERTKIATENRKEIKTIDGSLKKLRDTKKNLKIALAKQNAYSKRSLLGTGKIATIAGVKKSLDAELESLNDIYENISLKNMSKMFEGMSKAVDSDAERAKFEASQANIEKDDKVNVENLKRQIEMVDTIIEIETAAQNDYRNNDTAEKILKNQEMAEGGRVDSEPSPQDIEAMKWATDNPNDPRSKAIINKLREKGIK